MANLPSGRQYEIRGGGLHAVAVEVGGGLRELSRDGWQVLDGYPPEAMATAGRGQILAPWPNRLLDGRYRWEGEDLQLPLSEAARGNSIHGLVRWSAWQAVEHDADRVALVHRLHPQPGYPFLLDLRVEYRLAPGGLEVTFEATNSGVRPLPLGVGAHPYVRLGEGPVDEDELTLPARTCLQTDERQIPCGSRPVAGTACDFRRPRMIGALRLDTAFTDLAREAGGRAGVEVRRGGRRVRVWMDERFTHVMVFTGDTLAAAARRRSLAIEPMTCPPNALQTGEGLVRLEPGRKWSASWGIEAS